MIYRFISVDCTTELEVSVDPLFTLVKLLYNVKVGKINQKLAEGLTKGYGGQTQFEKINRGPFQGEQSKLTDGSYIDQWFAHELGGGQELVQTEDGIGTRVYAGGHIPEEKLQKLGLTATQVLDYHRKKLAELGERTRLDENCIPDPDGKWQYDYKAIDRIDEIKLTIGLETIHYQGIWFLHTAFLNPQ